MTEFVPPEIVAAVRQLRAAAGCCDDRDRARVREGWTDLIDACGRAQIDSARVWEIQARILAGQSDEVITAEVRSTPALIRFFEVFFFGTRESRACADWVLTRAIRPGGPWNIARPPTLGEVWRSFGFFGGAKILDALIGVTTSRPLPAWVASLPGADDPVCAARLRLSCELAVHLMRLPSDVNPRALFLLGLGALAVDFEKKTADRTNPCAERLDEFLADKRRGLNWPQVKPVATMAAG